jgi:hypothetical protein
MRVPPPACDPASRSRISLSPPYYGVVSTEHIGVISDTHMPGSVRELWPEAPQPRIEYEFDGDTVRRLN